MRRVLVTGGAGFVGRPAVAALVARGFEVHALGRRAPEGAHAFHSADLLDAGSRRAAVRAAGASHLLHLAWVTEPGRYWEAPENLDWTAASLDLVRAFHEAGGERAVVAGTCAEYDWTGIEPLAGPSPPSPRKRGEGRDDPVVVATSGSGGEGASTDETPSDKPPHVRLPARFGDDRVAEALSPHAGRGDASALRRGHLSESAPCRPATLYGAAKDGLRRILSAYAASSGLSLAWGRLFYLYGPGEAPGRLVGEAARALLAGRRFATSVGHQRRDFLPVTDAGEAFAALLDSGVEGPVNIGSGAAVPVRTILETLGRLTGRPELIDFGARPLPPTEPARIEADIRRLTDEVGFRPRLTLDEGLRATLAADAGQ
ncbi:MAG: NAD(P)-dependent oxidoreductase [Methylorubrum rhodinum]|uniref:NAD-dependent epimerase/dehydratase family protein n=1 Tax=Methylorubrum rhodinum TaxID=29428 RepID=UPI003BB0C8CF